MSKTNQSNILFLEKLCDEANNMGALEAAIIDAEDIVLDERVLLKCMVPRCANYGVNLTCPPNIISFDDFKRIIGEYNSAILISVSNASPVKHEDIKKENNLSDIWKKKRPADDDSCTTDFITDYLQILKEGQEKLYTIIEKIESLCLQEGYKFTAGLSAGGCSLCKECVGAQSGLPCRHPFKARPSMEGLGIDVVTTADRAGIKIEFNQDSPSWIGLILVD